MTVGDSKKVSGAMGKLRGPLRGKLWEIRDDLQGTTGSLGNPGGMCKLRGDCG